MGSARQLDKLKHDRKVDQDDQAELITELTAKLGDYADQSEKLMTELTVAKEEMNKSGGDSQETINSILLEKEKLTQELGEKLQAEITGREAAVKSKEKIEAKYEDLKESNGETKQMLAE